MSDVVRELVTRWGFEVNDKPIKDLRAEIGNLKDTVTVIGAAVAASAATIFGFAKLTADAGDAARVAATKLGISAQSLQKMQYAAAASEVSVESFGGGMKLLNKNIAEATKGNKEAIKNFASMGVSIRDASGKVKKGDVLFKQLSDRFAKMPDGPQKSAMAMELFGRAGADLLPFLNKGSAEMEKLGQRAEDLGVVLDEKVIAASDEFNDSVDEGIAVMAGLRNMVGAELMPVLTPLIQSFVEFVRINRKVIASKIGFFIAGLGKFLGVVWRFSKALVDSFSGLVQVFGGFEKVAKAVGIALGVFAGGSVLYGIGALALAMKGLVAWFTMANAAALAIPIMIGAAVVAIGLIIEDIVAFFQGKDSVTGLMVESFSKAFAALQEKFNQMSGWVKVFANVLLFPFRSVVNAIKTVIDGVQVIRGKMSAKDFLKNYGNNMLNTFGMNGNGTLGGALGFTPSNAPAAGQGTTQNSQKNQITNNITVNADSAEPTAIGRAASKGVNQSMDGQLRGAARSFKGASGGY